MGSLGGLRSGRCPGGPGWARLHAHASPPTGPRLCSPTRSPTCPDCPTASAHRPWAGSPAAGEGLRVRPQGTARARGSGFVSQHWSFEESPNEDLPLPTAAPAAAASGATPPPRECGARCSGAGAKGARQTLRASVFSECIREKSQKAGSSESGALSFLSPKTRWLESPWEHRPSQSGEIGAWSLQSQDGEARPCFSWMQTIPERNAELGAVMPISARVGTPTCFRRDPAAMRGVPQQDAHEPTSDTGPGVETSPSSLPLSFSSWSSPPAPGSASSREDWRGEVPLGTLTQNTRRISGALGMQGAQQRVQDSGDQRSPEAPAFRFWGVRSPPCRGLYPDPSSLRIRESRRH